MHGDSMRVPVRVMYAGYKRGFMISSVNGFDCYCSLSVTFNDRFFYILNKIVKIRPDANTINNGEKYFTETLVIDLMEFNLPDIRRHTVSKTHSVSRQQNHKDDSQCTDPV